MPREYAPLSNDRRESVWNWRGAGGEVKEDEFKNKIKQMSPN